MNKSTYSVIKTDRADAFSQGKTDPVILFAQSARSAIENRMQEKLEAALEGKRIH